MNKARHDATRHQMLRAGLKAIIVIPPCPTWDTDNLHAVKTARTKLLLRLIITMRLQPYFQEDLRGHVANHSRVVSERCAPSRDLRRLISEAVGIIDKRNIQSKHLSLFQTQGGLSSAQKLSKLSSGFSFIFMAPQNGVHVMNLLRDVFPDIPYNARLPRVPGEAFIYYPGLMQFELFEIPGSSTT